MFFMFIIYKNSIAFEKLLSMNRTTIIHKKSYYHLSKIYWHLPKNCSGRRNQDTIGKPKSNCPNRNAPLFFTKSNLVCHPATFRWRANADVSLSAFLSFFLSSFEFLSSLPIFLFPLLKSKEHEKIFLTTP